MLNRRIKAVWFDKTAVPTHMGRELNKAFYNDKFEETIYTILSTTDSKGFLVYVDCDYKILYEGNTLDKTDGLLFERGADRVNVYDVENRRYVLN